MFEIIRDKEGNVLIVVLSLLLESPSKYCGDVKDRGERTKRGRRMEI